MKWVLFDASWLAHRAMHAMSDLEHDGRPTGVIFGFLQELLHICQDPRIQSNAIGIFFDSRLSYRKDEFADYKSKRHTDLTPEEYAQRSAMHKQMKFLRRCLLPECGFPTYRQSGLESDDLMAMAADHIFKGSTGDVGVMITADGDLFQSIATNVDWFDPQRNLYYSWSDFVDAKGVSPKDWATVKCLAGCRGDGVPGVPGVAEKTAIQYLKGALKKTSKRYQAIINSDGLERRRANASLVVLPHALTEPFELETPNYNPTVFWRYAVDLGFASLLEGRRRLEWDSFFEGRFGTRQYARRRGAR